MSTVLDRLAFIVSGEKLGEILIGLPLYVREVFFYNFVEDIHWPFKSEILLLIYTYYP